jgi:hypothetical protein
VNMYRYPTYDVLTQRVSLVQQCLANANSCELMLSFEGGTYPSSEVDIEFVFVLEFMRSSK